MDFGLLPPEINSGRMYGGPGSGPMLAAAAAWYGLASELESAATSYGSVISNLAAGPWLGPSSAAMAAAAKAHVAWMSTTAAQAAEAATQAAAAAAAYGTAFMATVPPPVIAANRSLLAALVATNFLGQNTAAIAATETRYGEMWAQDAAAMYSYAGASASATTLTPFTPPLPIPAADTSAATNTQKALSPLTSAVPAALKGLASPLQSTSAAPAATSVLTGSLQNLNTFLPSVDAGLSSTGLSAASAAWRSASQASNGIIATQGQITDTQGLMIDTQSLMTSTQGQMTRMEDRIMARLGSAGLGAGGGSAALSTGLGQSTSIGALSVPQTWAAAAPAIRSAAAALPATSLGVAEIETGSSGSLFSEIALASMAGRAVGGGASMGRRGHAGTTTRAHVAPPQGLPGGTVTGIYTELCGLAKLRDSGILTDKEFVEQKRRLLGCVTGQL